MYVTRGMEGGHPKCLQRRTEGEGYHDSCVRTHLHYLFSCLMVSYELVTRGFELVLSTFNS